MSNAQARSTVNAVLSLLGPGGALAPQLERLKEHLTTALNAEQEVADLRKQLAPLQAELAALQADTKLASEQYAAKSAEIKSTLGSLQKANEDQESAWREKINALKSQADELEHARDEARAALARKMQQDQTDAGKKQAELRDAHDAAVLAYKLEEDAVRSRLESAKAELAAFLKRVGG
jgi:chromosome segregation ATPase